MLASPTRALAPPRPLDYAPFVIRHVLQTLLALLLVIGLVPGLAELVEQAVELAHHGHFAHSVEGEHVPDHAENGCTPVQHTCGCHTNSPSSSLSLTTEQPRFLDGLLWSIPGRAVRRAALDHPRLPELLAPTSWAAAPPTPPPNATV